jgi:hypothetical protein
LILDNAEQVLGADDALAALNWFSFLQGDS